MSRISLLFIAGMWLASGPVAFAQGRGNDKDKDKKEYKYDQDKKEKEYKDKDDKEKDDKYKQEKDRYKDGDGRYENRGPRATGGKLGGILGRVVLPPAGSPGPRQLAGVPRGHYPPPGQCRVWYPNRPAGHQPPPTSCERLRGIRLEPGAFILHGDRAYDTAYDWREEERRRPGSVARDILDILFPNR
ncbi:hypothetical protein [Hymenobacter glacieicola]|uniref:Uncharacterized protein n=1 Tax=Hymenobacter glacieicola TaxID=1562124 RepID=A0ABQ1WML9_9BACT|nr:hypothetical protein [Hymenobacter glacieicola]GGG37566.1 hypothetical protein GCM10011378_12340 [Hymenobacter glacieicola]